MYQTIYKCRLCGEEFKGDCLEEIIALTATFALVMKGNTYDIKVKNNIYKNKIHSCKDGSIGFSDFQGFKKLEDQKSE